MSEQLEESWYHECTNPECGIMMTVAFEREDGERQPMPAPKSKGEFDRCPICKGEWGEWIAGDAPTDNDDEEADPFDDEDWN